MHTLPHLDIVEENDLWVVGWVRSMEEIKEVLSSFMGQTNLDYRMYRKTKNFGYRGKNALRLRVRLHVTAKETSQRNGFFFALGKRHQKSKTGVSVTTQKGVMSSKFF